MRAASRAVILLALILAVPAAKAHVDLVAPAEGANANALTTAFEYYPSMSGLSQCTLTIDNRSFTTTNVTNEEFNNFLIANISEGLHEWRVTCENATTSEESPSRILVIDRTPPNATIRSPRDNATTNETILTFAATDDYSPRLSCTINANASFLTNLSVESGAEERVELGLENGEYVILLTCYDEAGNAASDEATITINVPPPPLYLNLTTNKKVYGLGEEVVLAINTLPGASLSIEVCPDKEGFVQCYTPILQEPYPQHVILPYTNKTGDYLIEGVALLGDQHALSQARYSVNNTIRVTITNGEEPVLHEPFTLTAAAVGAIGSVTYHWNLSNGSRVEGSEVTITYDELGTFTERVTVIDSEGNSARAAYTVTIKPEYDFTVLVKDAWSGEPLGGATVQVERGSLSRTMTTLPNGEASFTLPRGTYKLFVTLGGYQYRLGEERVTGDATVTVELEPEDEEAPVITIIAPKDGAQLAPPVTIRFRVEDESSLSCALSTAKEDSPWLEEAARKNVTPGAEESFTLAELEAATHSFIITCEDGSGNEGRSEERRFTVKRGAAEEEWSVDGTFNIDDYLLTTDRAYEAYDSFTSEERIVADLIGWESMIRERKRTIANAGRDLEALRYRRDLNEEKRAEKRAEIEKAVREAAASIPVSLAIEESEAIVAYPTKEEVAAIAPEVLSLKGYAVDPDRFADHLVKAQQGFTMKTLLVRARVRLANGTEQPLSLVRHSFTYKEGVGEEPSAASGGEGASGDPGWRSASLYVSLPETLVPDARLLETVGEARILREKPPVFEFRIANEIAYYAYRDAPLAELRRVKTLLLQPLPPSEGILPTGYAALPSSLGWPAGGALLALLILGFAAARLGGGRRLRYLWYALTGREGVQDLERLITEGRELLEDHELEKAMMRYKEARLAYERLPAYARNEAYEALEGFRKVLDASYFAILAERLREEISEGLLAEAIDDYERLEGTFQRLDDRDKEELAGIVHELARRLGAGGGV